MNTYLKYILTSLFLVFFGINLIGQSNENVSNIILSKEKLDNVPTATLKENKSIIHSDYSVNSQKVEVNLVPQNNQTELSLKDSNNGVSKINNTESSNRGNNTYNEIDVIPSNSPINNNPKASLKKNN